MSTPERDRLVIETGSRANDGTGSTLREAADIINTNFETVFNALGADPNTTFVNDLVAGTGITLQYTGDVAGTGTVTVTNSAPNIRAFTTVTVDSDSPVAASSSMTTLKLVSGSNIDLVKTSTATETIVTMNVLQDQADWDITNSSATGFIKNKPTDINDFTDTTNKFGHVTRLYANGHSLTLSPDGNVALPDGALNFPDNSGTIAYDQTVGIGSLDISSGAVDRVLNLYTHDLSYRWTFESTGVITFPDTSVQRTAWGAGRVIDVPSSSKGINGHLATDMAFGPEGIYFCIASYTDGLDDIWVKTPWAVTTAW